VRAEKQQVYMLELSNVGFVTKVSALISRGSFVLASIESKFFSCSICDRRYYRTVSGTLFCNTQNLQRTWSTSLSL